MVKEVKIQNGTEVAIVKVGVDGNLELVKEEQTQAKPTPVVEAAHAQGIPVSVQQEVDEYLELHAQMAELKAKQEKLKKSIRGYMDKNNMKAIQGTFGKQVYLQDAKASNATSRYTDYELKDIMKALYGTKLLREVTEVRINADRLEGLLKTAKLPSEKVRQIQDMKIVNMGTPKFTVKK